MTRYSIPEPDYRKALEACQDKKYKAHLLNDFILGPNGCYYPKIDRRSNG